MNNPAAQSIHARPSAEFLADQAAKQRALEDSAAAAENAAWEERHAHLDQEAYMRARESRFAW